MTRSIKMLANVNGGSAYGPLAIGATYVVADAFASDVVNRQVATYADTTPGQLTAAAIAVSDALGTLVGLLSPAGVVVPLGAGGGSATAVVHTDAIPLDTVGFGKAANAIVPMTAARTLSAATGPVVGGSYDVTFKANGNGAHGVTVPGAWVQTNSNTFNTANNQLNRYVFEYGIGGIVTYGILNLGVAPDAIPGQPTALGNSGVSANSATITWTAPVIDATHGTPLDYLYEKSVDGGTTWTTVAHAATPATTASLSGLASSTPHLVRVSGVNATGTGPASATTSFTTAASTAFSVDFTAAADTTFTQGVQNGFTRVKGTQSRVLSGVALINGATLQVLEQRAYAANGSITTVQNAGRRHSIIFRYADLNNYWELLEPNNGLMYLIKTVAGVQTVVTNVGCTAGCTTMKAIFNGANLSFEFNGVPNVGANTTDGALSSNTGAGFGADADGVNFTSVSGA